MRDYSERVEKFALIKLKKSGRKGVSFIHNKRSEKENRAFEVTA